MAGESTYPTIDPRRLGVCASAPIGVGRKVPGAVPVPPANPCGGRTAQLSRP